MTHTKQKYFQDIYYYQPYEGPKLFVVDVTPTTEVRAMAMLYVKN